MFLRRRIGVFGGTFNPVHIGHLVAAQEVGEKMKLDRIIFIPSAHPPHKRENNLAGASHRLKMLELAIDENPFFSLNTLEIERGGKSYSVETMRALRELYGEKTKIFFILGTDALAEIFTWKDVDEFLKLCRLIVVNRPGFLLKGMKEKISSLEHVSITPIGISSNLIRQRLHEGKSISSFVPEKVERYIKRHKLYK